MENKLGQDDRVFSAEKKATAWCLWKVAAIAFYLFIRTVLRYGPNYRYYKYFSHIWLSPMNPVHAC
jgi:hypothetical protein